MKAIIVTLVLVVGLLACSGIEVKKQAQVENTAWLDMCQLLVDEGVGYACNRLMPPIVVYEKMREGLSGYYDGGDYIYINEKLRGTKLFDVLMHEGIHYVHSQHGIIDIPGSAAEICWSENQAWGLTGIYFNEDNSLWWRAYPYCWQFYATSEDLRKIGWAYNEINSIVDGIIFED